MKDNDKCADLSHEDSFMKLLFFSAEALYVELNRIFKNYNITFDQIAILYYLYSVDGISQKTLAENIVKDQANTTRILRRLIEKNFVLRTDAPNDRRLNLVHITEEGKHLVESLEPLKNDLNMTLKNMFDDEDSYENVLSSLRKFLQIMGSEDNPIKKLNITNSDDEL